MSKPHNSNISPITATSPNQLGSITMSAYISFCILFFIVCLFFDWSIKIYIIVFWLCTFIIQFSMNLYGTNILWETPDPGKAIGYTIMPWLFVLGLTSFILFFMPGWVRVFSNTIGIAISKSIYSDLFIIEPDIKTGDVTPVQSESTIQLIQTIYNDPSKLINEVEYEAGYIEWVNKIYKKHLKTLEFFKNNKFVSDSEKCPEVTGEETTKTEWINIQKTDNTPLYQLYKCIAVKEKVGYFVWLFLIGCISVMVSLDQVLNADTL